MDPISVFLLSFFLGAVFMLPFLPCVWLSLGRASRLRRAILGSGLMLVVPASLTANTLSTGIALAMHLVAATCVLLAWRHFALEPIRFSLASLFWATFVLAVVLGLAVPSIKYWGSPASVDGMGVVSLAWIATAPTLICWASGSLKRRFWVLPIAAFGITALMLGWFVIDAWWLFAGMVLMFQAGFALGMTFIVRIYLRDYLIIFAAPVRRQALPDRLSWVEPPPSESPEEASTWT